MKDIKLKVIHAEQGSGKYKYIKVYYILPRGKKIYSMFIESDLFKKGEYIIDNHYILSAY
jgi:hypothetical protein